MGFKRNKMMMDFGETPIENLFITEFLKNAPELAIKVYLLAYKYSFDDFNYTNTHIMKEFGINQTQLDKAWDYWIERSIVEKIEHSEGYDIKFLSIREKFVESFYKNHVSDVKVKEKKIYDTSTDFRPFMKEVEQYLTLSMNQQTDIVSWILNDKISPDVILGGFKYTIETRKIKHNAFNYVKKCVEDWHAQGINSKEDLDTYLTTFSENYKHYVEIYRLLGWQDKPAAGPIEIMDKWLNTYHLPIGLLKTMITEITKSIKGGRTNIKYFDKVITDYHTNGINTIKKYEEYIKNHKNKSYNKTNTATDTNKKHKLSHKEIEKKLLDKRKKELGF